MRVDDRLPHNTPLDLKSHSHDVRYQLGSLSFLACIEKIGDPGNEARGEPGDEAIIKFYLGGFISSVIIAANLLNSAILSLSFSANPVDNDSSSGVSRLSFSLLASAPHFKSSLAHCVKARLATRCNGVFPCWSVTDGEAPSKRNAET